MVVVVVGTEHNGMNEGGQSLMEPYNKSYRKLVEELIIDMMLTNMTKSLWKKKIETTVTRAKELRKFYWEKWLPL